MGARFRQRPASPFRPQQSGARLVAAAAEAARCSTRAPLQARGLSGERGVVKEGRGGEERGKVEGQAVVEQGLSAAQRQVGNWAGVDITFQRPSPSQSQGEPEKE